MQGEGAKDRRERQLREALRQNPAGPLGSPREEDRTGHQELERTYRGIPGQCGVRNRVRQSPRPADSRNYKSRTVGLSPLPSHLPIQSFRRLTVSCGSKSPFWTLVTAKIPLHFQKVCAHV